MKEITRGIDIKNALDKALTRAYVPLNKLVSVVINGAPAMEGKRVESIGLMKCNSNISEFLRIHCIFSS